MSTSVSSGPVFEHVQQHGELAVHVRLGRVGGRLEVTGLALEGTGVVTSTTLRRIPVGRIRATAIDAYLRQRAAANAPDAPVINDADLDDDFRERRRAYWATARQHNAETPATERAIRVRITAETLADVADLYRRAVADHRPPIVTISEVYAVSRGVANKWVSNARRAGLLPPTTKGRSRA